MTTRNTPRPQLASRDQWASQVAALEGPTRVERARRPPITAALIVDTALQLVMIDGYEALTMRRVAAALQASPGALYVHVRDKSALDDLMIGVLSSRVAVPTPEPAEWRAQVIDVCGQLRDQYLLHPGVAGAVFATAPHNLDALRITEGLLSILLAGGVSARAAAWTVDAALTYVAAYSLMALRRLPAHDAAGQVVDTAELVARFEMLPADRFPSTVAHARELFSGEGHARFDFTLGQLLTSIDEDDVP